MRRMGFVFAALLLPVTAAEALTSYIQLGDYARSRGPTYFPDPGRQFDEDTFGVGLASYHVQAVIRPPALPFYYHAIKGFYVDLENRNQHQLVITKSDGGLFALREIKMLAVVPPPTPSVKTVEYIVQASRDGRPVGQSRGDLAGQGWNYERISTFVDRAGQEQFSDKIVLTLFGLSTVRLDYLMMETEPRVTPNPTAPVPEPAGWAVMLAGFGVTGAAMRRRSRGTVLAHL